MRKKILFNTISLLLLALTLGVCFAGVVDKIVVVVNDHVITDSEIESALKLLVQQLDREGLDEKKLEEVRKGVIERLIEEKLMLQEAKKQNIDVKNFEIEEKLQQVRSKFQDEKSFSKALVSQGINVWQLKKTYKDQIMIKKMIRKYLREHIQITPKQIADYYQKHPDDFKVPLAVNMSEILLRYKPNGGSARVEKTAMQVSELLAMGADFSVVAKKYSEGPNVQEGGNIGMVKRGDMSKEIDDVIFSMKESEVSKPIKTNIGFVILKLNYIQPEQIKPLVEVKGQIEELLLDDNAKVTISKWIEDLKEKAFISIKE